MEYDSLGNSKLSFYAGADISNLLLLFDFYIFFPCIKHTKM